MKLFYVEHSVVTTEKFALVARDEEHLEQLLSERKETFDAVEFSSKLQRDKKSAVLSHELNEDWTTVPAGPKWDGRS